MKAPYDVHELLEEGILWVEASFIEDLKPENLR